MVTNVMSRAPVLHVLVDKDYLTVFGGIGSHIEGIFYK
jgi:hypothetical protein